MIEILILLFKICYHCQSHFCASHGVFSAKCKRAQSVFTAVSVAAGVKHFFPLHWAKNFCITFTQFRKLFCVYELLILRLAVAVHVSFVHSLVGLSLKRSKRGVNAEQHSPGLCQQKKNRFMLLWVEKVELEVCSEGCIGNLLSFISEQQKLTFIQT